MISISTAIKEYLLMYSNLKRMYVSHIKSNSCLGIKHYELFQIKIPVCLLCLKRVVFHFRLSFVRRIKASLSINALPFIERVLFLLSFKTFSTENELFLSLIVVTKGCFM